MAEKGIVDKVQDPPLIPECLWCLEFKEGKCEPCRERKRQDDK